MQQYLDLLRHILKNGESHDDRTGVGTLSVFGYQFRHDMRTGFPLLTTKRLPFRWIAEELFWFLRGSTDEHELEAVDVDIWKEWATEEQCARFGRKPGDLGPVYGELWRRFPVGYRYMEESHAQDKDRALNPHIENWSSAFFIDQISWLMNEIVTNPSSRRLIVSGWHPHYQTQVALPPCHTLWQIKVHPNQYMSLHLYARSIDSFLGLPFNIASYGLLLSLIAIATGYEPKELVISFGDVHIYKNHMEQVKQQLDRRPRRLPHVEIPLQLIRGQTALERLLNFNYKQLSLVNYLPHPSISAEVAI